MGSAKVCATHRERENTMKDTTTWADLLTYLCKVDRDRALRSEYVIAAPWIDFGSYKGKALFEPATKRVCAWWNPGTNESYYAHITLITQDPADAYQSHFETIILAKFEDVASAERFTALATRFIFGLPEGEER